jgi:hypothetical protein
LSATGEKGKCNEKVHKEKPHDSFKREILYNILIELGYPRS